ncbi:hypothetical protein PFAS1_25335 [Pseudomonas frederiksbergensis]|nr:hypothetical protein PFAS1_25335 [Pseudomonas frederiksbergensis]
MTQRAVAHDEILLPVGERLNQIPERLSRANANLEHPVPIVPTLCVGMPQGTLRVSALERDAERPGLHSHAERGNDQRGND